MIEEHKELNFNNLLSFRAVLTQSEIQQEMDAIDKFINNSNLATLGPKISTTYSVTQGIVPTMDIGILIPVDKEFQENEKYKFKSKLRLVNALKSVYKGNPQGFNNTIMEVQNYIKDKNLMPITLFYTVNLHEFKSSDDIDKFHAELYISINPNII